MHVEYNHDALELFSPRRCSSLTAVAVTASSATAKTNVKRPALLMIALLQVKKSIFQGVDCLQHLDVLPDGAPRTLSTATTSFDSACIDCKLEHDDVVCSAIPHHHGRLSLLVMLWRHRLLDGPINANK